MTNAGGEWCSYIAIGIVVTTKTHLGRAKRLWSLTRGFTYPLPEKTVIQATESAEKAYKEWLSGETVNINGQAYRKGYNYKNDTLIRWLDITSEEQRELKTIIGTDEKYRRKNEARNKSRYGKDESGLTAKQRQREERDHHILEMHERGLSNRKIGELIKMSESGVRKALLTHVRHRSRTKKAGTPVQQRDSGHSH